MVLNSWRCELCVCVCVCCTYNVECEYVCMFEGEGVGVGVWCVVVTQHLCRVGQNRIYTPYMTVCMVISLPENPYINFIYL